ncbi:hypothetical protein GALMADRAFT_215850 [Galerina marginata CBS 339.88]|uniref:Peptidase S1 domain-containing protein n=1 Tax=Galerina marginata (strain CBS 339.88) TaxID=685588 RepID=A0A067SBX1_GALM3|nr:hypothetical protein GALMADRAFT_215850 [Galerina marginata CBS 339.88]
MSVERVRLSDKYTNAYTDFYGSETPCIYKTGPAWYKRTGNQAQGIYRAARPIYNHPIRPFWLSIGWRIVAKLDSLKVDWNAINPLAYADAGKADPFCPFVITIGVEPYSLLYDDAVAAGDAVLSVLKDAGFPNIQVAFIESRLHRSAGPKLLSLDPLLDPIAELRKDFSHALGLPIAPLKSPHFEGTGALYYRLGNDNDRVALLTCAHVAHPPPLFQNKPMTRKTNMDQAREDIIALGTGAYKNATMAITKKIEEHCISIEIWNTSLKTLGDEVEGENSRKPKRRNEIKGSIEKARRRIDKANKLLGEVTKYRSAAEQRVVGSVLHCSEIEVAVGSHQFTKDWSFIEIDREMIDWDNFKGNKIYVEGNKTALDFVNLMFSQAEDKNKFDWPVNGLLQAFGVVPESEFNSPQDFDIHRTKALLCTKHGLSTGTTFGRVNGLESFTRHSIHNVSIEIAVLGYDRSDLEYTTFSDPGDSGAIVVGRDGRIIGMLTGGGRPVDETDITYLTPYWWLEKLIKKQFPGCFLYPRVERVKAPVAT